VIDWYQVWLHKKDILLPVPSSASIKAHGSVAFKKRTNKKKMGAIWRIEQ
jgi:hypothetical protein